MNDRRGKDHITRILIRKNWKYTQKAIFLLDVLFVLLFAGGIIAGGEFFSTAKVLLCMALFLMLSMISLVCAYYIRTCRRRLLAVPFYALFWFVYEILLLVAVGATKSFLALFLVAFVLAVTMAVFPVWSYFSIALFYSIQIFACLGIIVSSDLGLECEIYVIMPQLLCVTIAVIRYYLETKHIKDRLSLENFIEESETDPLTGLLNRRGLARNLEAIWPYCERENCKVSIIMLDIDYFKLYNDSFGHPQGDICIQKISKAIASCMRRKTDCAARIGGEEFLILMPGMGGDDAVEWALNLKRSISYLGIRHSQNSPFPNVTVSIGVMSYDACKNMVFEDMKKQVDECLYMAKNYGRNCICANGRYYGVSRHSQVSEHRVI